VALVSVEVESDRRLSGPRLVRSSGSEAADKAVLAAAKKARLKEFAPSVLVERRVTLAVPVKAETATAAAETVAAK
jgi:TonB family protein